MSQSQSKGSGSSCWSSSGSWDGDGDDEAALMAQYRLDAEIIANDSAWDGATSIQHEHELAEIRNQNRDENESRSLHQGNALQQSPVASGSMNMNCYCHTSNQCLSYFQ
jgi:hypothetical protein